MFWGGGLMDYDTLVKKVKYQERIILGMQWMIVFLIIAVISLFALMMWQSISIINPIIDAIYILIERQDIIYSVLNDGFVCEVIAP